MLKKNILAQSECTKKVHSVLKLNDKDIYSKILSMSKNKYFPREQCLSYLH